LKFTLRAEIYFVTIAYVDIRFKKMCCGSRHPFCSFYKTDVEICFRN